MRVYLLYATSWRVPGVRTVTDNLSDAGGGAAGRRCHIRSLIE